MSDIIQQQDSRRVFINTLMDLAKKDDRILLIVPDVGFNYIEEFQKQFPNRYFNFGVTEEATILIATAMALDGWKPYVYSMINFVAFRPFEMVRNGIAMHKANVKLIGVKGSEKYKFLGFSHNMIFDDEDEYHLKPYLACRFPKNNEEVKNFMLWDYEVDKPVYMRL